MSTAKMHKKNNYFSDFCQIIGEVNYFFGLINSKKFNEIERDDHLFYLQIPNVMGHTIIGRQAAQLFQKIARTALDSDSAIRFRVSTQTVKKAIEWHFTDQILKSKKKLTPQLADQIVGKACKHVRKNKLITETRYIPCILSQEADRSEFWIGPVRFQTTESFFKENNAEIAEYTRTAEARFIKGEKSLILGQRSRLLPPKEGGWPKIEIKQTAKHFEDSLRDYLSTYRWVASTKLEGFDDHIGGRVVRVSIETALNILRLFIGASHADHFRIGGSFRIESKGVEIAKRDDGTIYISTRRQSEDATLGKDWISLILSGETEMWIHTAGGLIPFLQSGKEVPFLYQRLIDALWWYGEAVSEPLPHAKIIRYANALEVFLGTSPIDISHQIAVRSAYLCSNDVIADASSWFEKTKAFYDARSRIVHGRLSPMHPDIEEFVSLGETLVSRILMEGLSWTLYLSHQNFRMSEKELSHYFDHHLPLYAFDLVHDSE